MLGAEFFGAVLAREFMENLRVSVALASARPKLTFVGRLGNYRYLALDRVSGDAMDLVTTAVPKLTVAVALSAFGHKRDKRL